MRYTEEVNVVVGVVEWESRPRKSLTIEIPGKEVDAVVVMRWRRGGGRNYITWSRKCVKKLTFTASLFWV